MWILILNIFTSQFQLQNVRIYKSRSEMCSFWNSIYKYKYKCSISLQTWGTGVDTLNIVGSYPYLNILTCLLCKKFQKENSNACNIILSTWNTWEYPSHYLIQSKLFENIAKSELTDCTSQVLKMCTFWGGLTVKGSDETFWWKNNKKRGSTNPPLVPQWLEIPPMFDDHHPTLRVLCLNVLCVIFLKF